MAHMGRARAREASEGGGEPGRIGSDCGAATAGDGSRPRRIWSSNIKDHGRINDDDGG